MNAIAHPAVSPPSLGSFFNVVRPHLAGSLASPQALLWLDSLCQLLPETDLAGFEHSLSSPEPRVDLTVRLPKLALNVPKPWTDTPAWTRVDRINRRLVDGRLPGVRVIDLEFDLTGPPADVPIPAVFLELDLGPQPCPREVVATAGLLSERPLDEGLARTLQSCASALPATGRISHLGAMFSRPGSGQRIVVSGVGAGELAAFVERVPWRGNVAALKQLLDELEPRTDTLMLGLHVDSQGVHSRLGIECLMHNAPSRRGRFEALLAHFRDKGLCSETAAHEFIRWQGVSRAADAPGHWPTSLAATERLLAGQAESLVARFVSHLKVVVQGDVPVALKGYRGFCHYFVPTRSVLQPVADLGAKDTATQHTAAQRRAAQRTARVRDIAARSAFWFERCVGPRPEAAGGLASLSPAERDRGEARLSRWRQAAAGGDPRRFERRLRWTGLDHQGAIRVLGAPAFSLPQSWWEPALGRLVDWLSVSNPTGLTADRGYLHAEEPLPFEHALVPIVDRAVSRLLVEAPRASTLLSAGARDDLARALLRRLSRLSERTLEREFNEARGVGPTMLAALGIEAPEGDGDVRYREFVGGLCTGGWISLLTRYPVLARFVATALDLWIEGAAEFVARVQADRAILTEVFGPIDGLIEGLQLNLSDPHHRGRSVAIVRFAGGRRLVYKPKPLGLEVAYCDLLAWLSERGAPLPLKGPTTVDLGTHGWVEFIENRACPDEEAVKRFFIRSGMLLCVLYCLGANDCHVENLIADGEHMMLIDAETLLNPTPPAIAEETSGYDSVLRVGLLPRWDCRESTRHVIDLSGLGFTEGQRDMQRVWRSVNSDGMRAAYDLGEPHDYGNLPVLAGAVCSPDPYVDLIERGFGEMYRFMQQHRDALLARGGPISAFASQTGRFLFRGTRVYVDILEQALSPDALADGLDASVELGRLDFAYLVAQERPPAWPLLKEELRALAQLDVPHFRFDTSATTLCVADGPLEQYFDEDAYGRLEGRFAKMCDADLKIQMRLIGASVAIGREHGHREQANGDTASGELVGPETSPGVGRSDMRAQARALAAHLQQQAIDFDDGYRSWLGQIYIRNSEHFHVNLLPVNLYDGGCGVAVFLAECHRLDPAAGFDTLALQATQRLRRLAKGHDEGISRLIRRLDIGGALGVGSVVYGLVGVGRSLGRHDLIQDALRVAKLIDPQTLRVQRKFDVMEGVSGLLLGLLAAHSSSGDTGALELAKACGERLVDAQLRTGPWRGGWQSADEATPPVGLSHGASGIALALARLYGVTGTQAFAKAVGDGLAFERRAYTPPKTTVADFGGGRQDGQGGPSMNSWCHGATGIALSRLACWEILGDSEILSDAHSALQAVQDHGLRELDHLCCGNFGRVEALLVGARVLGRPELRATALRWTGEIVGRANASGSYRLRAHFRDGAALQNPAFFQGLAGIGYTLLRVADPERVPSVAVWG